MLQLIKENFDEKIAKGVVIVDFWAPWCGPCMSFGPIFEKVGANLSSQNLSFAKVNIDDAPEIASDYGVRSIPTIIAFKDGQEVERLIGAADEEKLKEWAENI